MARPKSDPPSGKGDWRELRELSTPPECQLSEHDRAVQSLIESFELHERGVRMMRMNLRRDDPAATEEELDARIRTWLGQRSGAPFGDGVGRPAPERLARILDGAS